ncbi:hypothetical protein Pyn_40469 [Prunus yedoensis var. nudiflora]|uniref:RING-type domain-containing protein n=1 Tax=Prunus yedoensis var. nudiflora TaxID=2094558 RepID=A0A314ZA84_PRUYE|nr:hypothetical protein Pyn_40469 [Prunus yedoensis var. nudiflora]
MQTNHPIPVEDQYHLKFKLFKETETVWTDEDDVPVDVSLEPPRFDSELDITLSRADLLLVFEESHGTNSAFDSISLMADALAAMEIPEFKHEHIIGSFLAGFKAKQRECLPHVVSLVMKKNKKQRIGGEAMCAICREEFENGTNGNRRLHLPCSHIFHVNCIEKWLETCPSHRSCPLCRFPLSRRFDYQLVFT